MVPLDLSALAQLSLVVLVVAVLGATAAVLAATSALLGHRRLRLTRHQSVGTYYRGLAPSH